VKSLSMAHIWRRNCSMRRRVYTKVQITNKQENKAAKNIKSPARIARMPDTSEAKTCAGEVHTQVGKHSGAFPTTLPVSSRGLANHQEHSKPQQLRSPVRPCLCPFHHTPQHCETSERRRNLLWNLKIPVHWLMPLQHPHLDLGPSQEQVARRLRRHCSCGQASATKRTSAEQYHTRDRSTCLHV